MGEMDGDLEYVFTAVADRWVVIQFAAEWSGTCAAMKQSFVDLARQHVDAVFVHCDVESLTKLAKEYAVTRIPTYGYFYNGVLEAEFAGASERKMRDVLQDCLDLGPVPKSKEESAARSKRDKGAPAPPAESMSRLSLDLSEFQFRPSRMGMEFPQVPSGGYPAGY